MRKHMHIDVAKRSVIQQELKGDEVARTGRYYIAKTLLEGNLAKVDPLSPQNPLIFTSGPFSGTSMSNANRISVGCKSPLTGGIKEANSGGTFAVALGQLGFSGFTLHGASDSWIVIRVAKDGSVSFDPADEFLGLGNFEAEAKLHEKYGAKTSVALCGPVGEYLGLLAGVAFSDRENRPARLSARGGVGAVMGSKKVKAVVVEFDKMPPMADMKGFFHASKEYAKRLGEQPAVKYMHDYGTAGMADHTNYAGGMPTNNFSSGQVVDRNKEPLKLGGEYIRERIIQREGHTSHACMSGCVIQCSNVYLDEKGTELVSPLEYETLCLMGSNCGLTDPDDVARLNFIANDLGIDTIEVGATLGVLMEAGQAKFGDIDFLFATLEEIRRGTEKGRILAQGTARVGEHYGVKRVPVIKKQAISAYDPRVIEGTGVTMMSTAQGADHTAGNLPQYDATGKSVQEVAEASLNAQIGAALADSLGLCIFGRTGTETSHEVLADAINKFHGLDLKPPFLRMLGIETLRMERDFNIAAGFAAEDDELPAFFYNEDLPPTNKRSRYHGVELNRSLNALLDKAS